MANGGRFSQFPSIHLNQPSHCTVTFGTAPRKQQIALSDAAGEAADGDHLMAIAAQDVCEQAPLRVCGNACPQPGGRAGKCRNAFDVHGGQSIAACSLAGRMACNPLDLVNCSQSRHRSGLQELVRLQPAIRIAGPTSWRVMNFALPLRGIASAHQKCFGKPACLSTAFSS